MCLSALVLKQTEYKWTHWGLSPGPSACEADVIPLHHVPDEHGFVLLTLHSIMHNVDDVSVRPIRTRHPLEERGLLLPLIVSQPTVGERSNIMVHVQVASTPALATVLSCLPNCTSTYTLLPSQATGFHHAVELARKEMFDGEKHMAF